MISLLPPLRTGRAVLPIEELAERATFLECAYLLIWGKLPDAGELSEFVDEITVHTMLHENVRAFYGGFPKAAHPMAVCSSVVAALSAFYPEFLDPRDKDAGRSAIVRLMAKFPTIAAFSYSTPSVSPSSIPTTPWTTPATSSG